MTAATTTQITMSKAMICRAQARELSSLRSPSLRPTSTEAAVPIDRKNTLNRFVMVEVIVLAATTFRPRSEYSCASSATATDHRSSFTSSGMPLTVMRFASQPGI